MKNKISRVNRKEIYYVKKNSSNIYEKFYHNNGNVVIEDLIPKTNFDELLKIF